MRLLITAQLNLLGVEIDEEVNALHSEIWQRGRVAVDPLPVGSDDQPLWYTEIDRPLMFLCSRRAWPILDPINVSLASEILEGFDSRVGGWKNYDDDESLCTWRTAESLLAVELLTRDLRKQSISPNDWQARRTSSTNLLSNEGFDVGISFSSDQREIASRIREHLRKAGLVVFYDEDYAHELLGAELNVYLHDTYFRRCRYAIAILSHDFVRSNWSGSLEWRAILARLQEARSNFLLPYFVEEVDVPGLSPSIGFLSAKTHTPEQFAEVVVRKILDQRM